MVLASDGVWDEIKRSQSAELARANSSDMKNVATALFNASLDAVSKESGKLSFFKIYQ